LSKRTSLSLVPLLIALCHAEAGAQPGYSGPSVLSSPGAPLGRWGGGTPLSFRFYAGAYGRYDTNLTAPELDDSGNLRQVDASYGATGNFGVYGVHQRARDVFALTYHGQYRYYAGGNREEDFGRYHQAGVFNYARQVSMRTEVFFAQSVSNYRSGYWGMTAPLVSDPLLQYGDSLDYGLDSPSLALGSSGGVSHQLTSRWGVTGGVSGFYLRRSSDALINTQGYTASGSVFYLLWPTQRIGGTYQFGQFFYSGDFGQTDYHQAYLHYGRHFSRFWTMSVGAGVSRAYINRQQQVKLDPVISAILGQGSVLEAAHFSRDRVVAYVTLGRQFERSSLSFHYRRHARPGGGYYTTTQSDSAGAHYSYTATERMNIGAEAHYRFHSAIAEGGGQYKHYGASLGLAYRLAGGFHATARARIGQIDNPNATLTRSRLGVSAGVTWSPGDMPLSIF
jgi:hypothetical protein